MIRDLKPYPEYKDSGVEWLGEVPAHWEVRRLRNVVDMRVSNVDKHSKEGEQPVRLCNYVDVYKQERIRAAMQFMTATATADEIERFRLKENDVLITKDSEAWDDIGVPALVESAALDLISGYHLALLRPRCGIIEGAYLLRALQSRPVSYQFHVEAKGVTRYGLSHQGIKSCLLPLPPLAEQTAIVRFLDYVDRRVGRVIRGRQRLVGLLEEYKQALIHQAVTGRIDVRTGQPYPEYKDSGVAWLGQVPAHWEVRRNAQLFRQRNETGHAALPVLEVSLKTGIQIRDVLDGSRKQELSDRDGYKRVLKGEIAYNMMRMWQGAVGVAPVDGLVSPAYIVAVPRQGVDSRYYALLFRIPEYKDEIDRNSRGIVKDRNRLYWEDFKRIESPFPPLPEQTAIVEYLDEQTGKLDRAVDAARREIELLKEFRTRLIADVVTGKLDVREVAARLPEEHVEQVACDETEPCTVDLLDDTPCSAEFDESSEEVET
ncbi:MAG: hypothetical protein KatS3mg111_4176 [Pirellulaceae bacterium]|nr:MAG: hypothetical protein KatS3mg111_4176 [Pirellulaceae bacterium]